MATKAGVWIDHKQAIVVLISDAGHAITKVQVGGEKSLSPRAPHKYTPNDFIAEDRLDHKLAGDRKQLYDKVLAAIQDSDALLILGPGEAKGEFQKQIVAKKRRGLTIELETADKTTDRQLAAKVGAHFAKAAPRKTAAARPALKKVTATKKKVSASAAKKTAKAASKKTTKKAVQKKGK